TGVRDYIHVEDLAAAHISALSYLQTHSESQILNCGYGKGYSVREVLEKVKEIAEVDFPIIETSRRKGDPACVIASAEKIRKVLGWKPRYQSLDQIIRSALAWEKKNLVDC
ncbi:MAG: UDP-glucose 4-epimerase GalE, partial [Xenococcus sp. (in: cyanobacteria)]